MEKELIKTVEDLECDYELNNGELVIYLSTVKDKVKIICKQKEKGIIVLKIKNNKLISRNRFFNFDNLRSFICCQFALECIQLA